MKRVIFTEETNPQTTNAYEVRGIVARNGTIRIRCAEGFRNDQTFVFNRIGNKSIDLDQAQSDTLISNATSLSDLVLRAYDFIAAQKSGSVVDD